MTVKHGASGRRSIELEVEVPGTPEEVWQAIATGPGISGWFFPAEVEERPGGRVVWHMEPGMDAPGAITAWEPPRRLGDDAPAVAAREDPAWQAWMKRRFPRPETKETT